ncbi:MAG TPA: Gx transporter family protein [Methylomusa anaerophila]|nr:Gx transporter family protein [Methylomusa anaerophila]HML89196.1 Gx transporter family protein [Methylomusa anaerophila]
MSNTRRIVLLALLVAIAGILHVMEGWLPLLLPLPGAKLGLANIVSLYAIVVFTWRDALYIAVVRVILGSLFSGALFGPAFVMSMGGALTSLAVMTYSYNRFRGMFSVVGVSMLGATVHNIAQVVFASILVSSASLLWYTPYLILFAVPTGFFTGAVVIYLLDKAPMQLRR